MEPRQVVYKKHMLLGTEGERRCGGRGLEVCRACSWGCAYNARNRVRRDGQRGKAAPGDSVVGRTHRQVDAAVRGRQGRAWRWFQRQRRGEVACWQGRGFAAAGAAAAGAGISSSRGMCGAGLRWAWGRSSSGGDVVGDVCAAIVPAHTWLSAPELRQRCSGWGPAEAAHQGRGCRDLRTWGRGGWRQQQAEDVGQEAFNAAERWLRLRRRHRVLCAGPGASSPASAVIATLWLAEAPAAATSLVRTGVSCRGSHDSSFIIMGR